MLKDRGFEFSVERAISTTVLHRIMASGSDRACEKWLADYAIADVEGLALHHFYRGMAWLGEELDESDQADATPFSPRTLKDEIEERLYARRRDLFTDLLVVFMDTTSLSFEGQGGEPPARHGHSKDKRPDLKQRPLAAVIDNDGQPICSEMMPGDTADVSVLLPIVDRLHQRFGLKQVCVVADRGMISVATSSALFLLWFLGRTFGPAAKRPALSLNGKTSCVTSIVCRKSPSNRTVIPSSCAYRQKARLDRSSRSLVSP